MSQTRTSSVRAALSGLTTRGRSFLAAGVACTAMAFLLGQRDILRVAVLLAALPLAAAWVVSRSRYRLSCTRRLDPVRVSAGSAATVSLRLDNVSRLPTGLLLVEDRVPYVLGSRPRFVLDRVETQGYRSVTYTVRSDVRGQYTLGPLSIRMTDPFSLCELQRSFSAVEVLTVAPVVVPLSPMPLGGQRGGTGESTARALAAAGEDDVTTREYRHGDPLHRVHWRSTARRGELMVRREEQPWQSRATVILDMRADAHRGEGPGSSFEFAVSAAASMCVHLARRGYLVRLVTGDGVELVGSEGSMGAETEGLLLDALALVQPTASQRGREPELGTLGALGATIQGSRDGLVVLVMGSSEGSPESQVLAGVAHYVRTGVAVLMDTASWSSSAIRPSSGSSGIASTAALLTAASWRVITLGAGEDFARAWEADVAGQSGVGSLRVREVS